MRFLHTSDWHLGRILHGVHLTDDQAYVLAQFVAMVKDTRPDAVVIAGDVYDRSVPPVEAVELLNDVLAQLLLDCGVPVLMIAGNHDSAERLGFASRLLAKQNLFVTGLPDRQNRPVCLHDAYGPVYFSLLPYAEPALVRERLATDAAVGHERALLAQLTAQQAYIPDGARRVAVAHAFLAGGSESESERPLAVGGSAAVRPELFAGYHYTALGHLHRPQAAGQECIRYSGSLLKYSFAEAEQAKGIELVELDEQGRVRREQLKLTPRRDVKCRTGCFADLLQACLPGMDEDYLAITLTDTQPILDAMGRLREVYPNVLHIERPALLTGAPVLPGSGVRRELSDQALFAAFFEQMTGTPLAAAEEAALQDLINAWLAARPEGGERCDR